LQELCRRYGADAVWTVSTTHPEIGFPAGWGLNGKQFVLLKVALETQETRETGGT
jgi:hypothetical protein